MTKVINLLGGSGLGKSTTAAGLFYTMKLRGYHCELIREYVKQWAWDGIKIQPLDQVYIFGKQAKAEMRVYNKVDVAVTDSPLLLSPIYELFYSGKTNVKESALGFLADAKTAGVEHHYFLLERHKPFDTRGRFETEEQAKAVDAFVVDTLTKWGIPYTVVSCRDRDRVEDILSCMGL